MLELDPAPILERTALISAVAERRRAGKSIILANGCFDLFHVGHLRYLQGAKALGGTLVAAVNSDRQTRAMKGEGRPFVPQNERAEIIAALRCVDLVTIFDEPTVEHIIYAIRPDIHTKGTDYTAETVPERDIMREIGGKVIIVGDPKEHSSTEIIRSIGDHKI